jgi:predicted protein tyrosine phosphatase
MLVECFQRHLAVTSRDGAARLIRTDRRFWNVVSICSPTTPPLNMADAVRIHRMRFEDTEQANDPDAVCVPRAEDLAAVFTFADETAPGPLLVHCQMGLSRSTAVALVLLVRKLWPAPDALTTATAALLEVRPQSRPNSLVARLGFELFMPPDQARLLAQAVIDQPQFAANRAATSVFSVRGRLPYER